MTASTEMANPTADDVDVASGAHRRAWWARWTGRRLVAGALAAVLIASCAVMSWLYLAMYRPDRQASAAVADAAVKAATAGTVAVLSYKPDTAAGDFATAKSHLTGEFLTYYDHFTQEVVGPAVQQKGVRTTAAIVQAAVSDLRPDSAVVLLFVNQSTSSAQNPEPSMTASSVNVGLRKVHGDWLISSFDPI
jgi:Mce-associated membrane protein